MIQTRAIRPRRVDEALQGCILQELLNRLQTVSELAHHTRKSVFDVRIEVIALHHLGVIEPRGLRTDTIRLGKSLYDRDYLWGITEHGMSHHSSQPGCLACRLREKVLLLAGGYAPWETPWLE